MDVTYALDMLQQAKERAIALTALQNAGEGSMPARPFCSAGNFNSSWKLEYVSSNVQRWGYKADEFINGDLTMSDLLHPEDLHRVWAEVIRHIESRHREYILELHPHRQWRISVGGNHATTSFDRKGKPQRFGLRHDRYYSAKTNELQITSGCKLHLKVPVKASSSPMRNAILK